MPTDNPYKFENNQSKITKQQEQQIKQKIQQQQTPQNNLPIIIYDEYGNIKEIKNQISPTEKATATGGNCITDVSGSTASVLTVIGIIGIASIILEFVQFKFR